MTISTYQHENVTKREFYEFKIDTGIRLDNIEIDISELKTFVSKGFDKIEEYIDNSFIAFSKEMDIKLDQGFDKNKKEIISELDRKIDEKMDLKLEKSKIEIIEALDKKIDEKLNSKFEKFKVEIITGINNK